MTDKKAFELNEMITSTEFKAEVQAYKLYDIQDLIEEVEKGQASLMTIITEHGHEMDRQDLIEVIKELDYAIYTASSHRVKDFEILIRNNFITGLKNLI